MNDENILTLANYCVSFIDLLGQRGEYKEEGLLPKYESAEEKEKFETKVRNTIGKIDFLQQNADRFVNTVLSYRSPETDKMPTQFKQIYDKVKEVHLSRQRWSDGILYFISLQEGDVACPAQSVNVQLTTVCYLCFFGLVSKTPLRGAMDIAWAAELHKGELYGPAVAKAYELEAYVAQYPRIVIGQRVVDYLVFNLNKPVSNIYDKVNQAFAKASLDMLGQDFDGYHAAHYLGPTFQKMVSQDLHKGMYEQALSFVQEQCKRWKDERNTKLSFRYNQLLLYFLANPPFEAKKEASPS